MNSFDETAYGLGISFLRQVRPLTIFPVYPRECLQVMGILPETALVPRI
jgi:hypothetical protein